MIPYCIFILTVLFLTACGQNPQQQQTHQNSDSSALDSIAFSNDPNNNLNIQTNGFSEIDSSGIFMFPLSIGDSERIGNLSYGDIPDTSYWNIIFLNSKTDSSYFLSDKKILITNYAFKYGGNDNIEITQKDRYIFYSIISEDYNKDKILNNKDPKYLYISDRKGNNLRQISPDSCDLQNWQFIKSVNKVLLTVKKDRDKNNKFDYKEEITMFEVDIGNGTDTTKEVFSTEFKNTLKILYDIHWKRLNK